MKRDILKIDESKCTGCGLCIPGCHEGALKVIDGKVRLISELMCDGLGACIGHCPEGAISIENREAEPYDEVKVIENMIPKGFNTLVAHLKHLKDHNEFGYLKQGIAYLMAVQEDLSFDVAEIQRAVHGGGQPHKSESHGGGCPGSRSMSFNPADLKPASPELGEVASQLRQWPVQLHLINPGATYFDGADLLVAADCTAFALGDFHQKWLKNKSLVIACPKLDQNKESYLQKLIALIDSSKVNTITVLIMEVPCCGGLLHLVQMAISKASRKVPVKAAVVSVRGEILSEDWI